MNQDVKALPVVAYGYANARTTGERHSLLMVQLDNSGDQYPELALPLVLKSDAESALAELLAEVERLTACIEQMTSDLARCRDAFGIPAGDGHLSDAWTSAMAMPEEVPHYVEAAAANLERVRRAAQRALDAWDSTVFPQAHDGMMQERMEELREECIEQARVDKQRADTAEARLERARGLLELARREIAFRGPAIGGLAGDIAAFLGEGK